MAAVQDDSDDVGALKTGSAQPPAPEAPDPSDGQDHDPQTDDDEDDDDDDETEPKLKYSRLTGSLASVYRKGDSTSSVLTVGDKTIIGTHNGNIHVLSLPSLQSLRLYHAHSASITSISVSPFASTFPTSLATTRPPARPQSSSRNTPTKSNTVAAPSRAQTSVPATPSNSIYIATSSIDGHVCVSSLVDPKDVILRNFARPVQAVALSPEYISDRMFLSGGLSGNLILTIGGRAGVSSDANTNSAAAAASGWLGSIGLGSSSGKDTVLHSGEGSISTIAWSRSGKYVAWVNEKGIKIMRSSIGLERGDSELAWKRIAHIDHPTRQVWEGMSGVWKARAHWSDERHLENDDGTAVTSEEPALRRKPSVASISTTRSSSATQAERGFNVVERLIVGWGDTVWVVDVRPGGASEGKPGTPQKPLGKASIPHQFIISDGVVSGLSPYTPTLLLVVVFRTRDDDDLPISNETEVTPKRGIRRRHNALPPDLRLIDLGVSPEQEIDVEGLTFSKCNMLSAADYNVSTLFVPPAATPSVAQLRRFASLGVSALGGALWDAGKQSTRIFSSSASVLSGSSSGAEKQGTATTEDSLAPIKTASPGLLTPGLKVFIHSPYDCILAMKREASDKLKWLLERRDYAEAWHLIDTHPEIVASGIEEDSRPSTPSAAPDSLAEFFEDGTSIQPDSGAPGAFYSASEKEKRRVGDLWVQQLVDAKDWQQAAETASKVIGTSSRWEHWIWVFAEANKFDEITPFIPTQDHKSRLPSTVYELILAHYLNSNTKQFEELMNTWDLSLFDASSLVRTIKTKLESREVQDTSIQDGIKGRDWSILQNALATLYLEGSKPAEALYCYLRTGKADAALDLVKRYRLLAAISDKVYSFITVNVSADQMDSSKTTLDQLEALSAESIQLLAAGALQNLIPVASVIDQLEPHQPQSSPFLFFYFKTLWEGVVAEDDTMDAKSVAPTTKPILQHRFGRKRAAMTTQASTRALLSPYVNTTVSLFAEYSRQLLGDLLKSSDDAGVPLTDESDFYEHALAECERRSYVPELVSLLSATGQNQRALHLIIDKIGDVKQAISFAKEVDDEDLWEDLLKYSMDKPAFVRGLLIEGGSSGGMLRPEELVRRIPIGLDIPGLKEGLVAVLHDSDLQASIAEGAARVSQSEVALKLDELVHGRMKGVSFDLQSKELSSATSTNGAIDEPSKAKGPAASRSGHCSTCTESLQVQPVALDGEESRPRDHLLAFQCGHIYHLECLLDHITTPDNAGRIGQLQQQLEDEEYDEPSAYSSRHSVGAKMARAQMIAGVLGDIGCTMCER